MNSLLHCIYFAAGIRNIVYAEWLMMMLLLWLSFVSIVVQQQSNHYHLSVNKWLDASNLKIFYCATMRTEPVVNMRLCSSAAIVHSKLN